MEMFLVSVGFYGIGVLTMLLPHGMQRAAHWLANSAALFGSAVCAYAAGLLLFGGVSPAPPDLGLVFFRLRWLERSLSAFDRYRRCCYQPVRAWLCAWL